MKRVREENVNTMAFWNRTWDAEPPWRSGFGIDPVRFAAMAGVLEHVENPNLILDVGGGRGEFLAWLDAFSSTANECGLSLVDISHRGPVEALREDRVELAVTAEATELPFADSWFDVVFAGEILEHLEEPAAFLAELARVVLPGGWISLSTPNEDAYPDIQHVWEFDAGDVERLLSPLVDAVKISIVGGYIIAWGRVHKLTRPALAREERAG